MATYGHTRVSPFLIDHRSFFIYRAIYEIVIDRHPSSIRETYRLDPGTPD